MQRHVMQTPAVGPWRPLFWLLALLACGLPGNAPRAAEAGQDPGGTAGPADTLRLSWTDFQSNRARHPRLAEARAAIREAEGATRAARALPNPSWEARVLSVDPLGGGDPAREDEWSVSVPVDWLWTRPGAVKAARATKAQAEAEARLVEQAVQMEAGAVFWGLVRDQALVESLDELSHQLQDLRQAVETRVRVGEARPVEATRARVEALQAELEAAAALRSLALSREQFARWLPAGERRVPLAMAALETLVATPEPGAGGALPDHPLLQAARARVGAQRGALAVERGRILPKLELLASLERADDRRSTGAGLAVELPLFNWNRGPIQQAHARLDAAEAGLETERRRWADERAAALAACESSREEARAYREQILPQAEEAARVLTHSWRVGESNLFELIDARRTLAATRRQAILVYCQAQLDGLRLEILLEKETNK